MALANFIAVWQQAENSNSLFKVIAFFITWVLMWLPFAIALLNWRVKPSAEVGKTSAIALKGNPSQPLSDHQKLPLIASLYLIAPLLVWGAAELEGLQLSDYGWVWEPSVFRSFILGIALAIGGLLILFGCQWIFGWLQWQPPALSADDLDAPPIAPETAANASSVQSVWLPSFLLGCWVGGTEELVFRGFLLTTLQQDYSLWIAAAIASGIFAFTHLIWEQRQTIPQLPGLWLLGMVLVLARVCDRTHLGLAWGLHAGWIWAIATLDTAGVIHYTGKAPQWVTGMAGKPLAGMAGILCLLGTGGILWGLIGVFH